MRKMGEILIQLGMMCGLLFLFSCGGQKLASQDDKGQNAVINEQIDLINTFITDATKKNKLLAILNEVEKKSVDFFRFYHTHQFRLAELNQDFAATHRDFENEIAVFNKEYEKYLKMLVDKREEMRLATTREEWQKIMDRKSSFIPE